MRMSNGKLLQLHFETCGDGAKFPPLQADALAPRVWSIAALLAGNQAYGGMTLPCPHQSIWRLWFLLESTHWGPSCEQKALCVCSECRTKDLGLVFIDKLLCSCVKGSSVKITIRHQDMCVYIHTQSHVYLSMHGTREAMPSENEGTT